MEEFRSQHKDLHLRQRLPGACTGAWNIAPVVHYECEFKPTCQFRRVRCARWG
jgi:hypothetical protein